MADWTSGLDDDQAGIGGNVTSPLDALGIDPDEALTNRAAVMAQLNQSPLQRMQAAYQKSEGATAPPAPSPSVAQAGALGGAGAASAPAPTAAAVSPAGSSAATPGKSLEQYGMSGLEGLETNMNQATAAAAVEPTEDPAGTALEAQRAHDVASAPNPANYKPSGWQKVGRGLEGVALGLAGGGIPGAIVGGIKPGAVGSTNYDAPTSQYGQDASRNQQAVASDDQQIQSAKDRFKQLTDARKNQAADFRATAGLGKDLTSGATGMENAQTDATVKPLQAQAEVQKAKNDDPNTKLQLTDGQFQQRQQQADRLGLRGTTRSLYILNGKVPDPRQATADEIATGKAEKIFRQQYGRGPQTIEEFGKIQQMAKGQQDRASGGSGGSVNDRALLRVYAARVNDLQKQLANPFLDDDSRKSLQATLTEAQQDFEDAKSRVSASGAGSPNAAPAPAAKKPPPAVGSTVMVDGKSMRVVGINPKTGKPQVAPL